MVYKKLGLSLPKNDTRGLKWTNLKKFPKYHGKRRNATKAIDFLFTFMKQYAHKVLNNYNPILKAPQQSFPLQRIKKVKKL